MGVADTASEAAATAATAVPDTTATSASATPAGERAAAAAAAAAAAGTDAAAGPMPPVAPLLRERQRLTVYPLANPELWQHYKRQLASFWTPEEIDFSKDREQWNSRLNDDERRFVRAILAFFAASDSVVSLNIMNAFCSEVKLLEAQVTYTYQAMMENIHAEVYSIMIDTYVTDPDERDDMFSNLGSLPSVRGKVDWARRWSLLADEPDLADERRGARAPFARRLLAYVIVEGLFFSGAFCAIYWLKQRNLLPGLTKSNEFIARDEGQHTEFACTLYGMLGPARLPEHEAAALFREAVGIEKQFILESVPCRLVGMNPGLMSQYIEYVADGLLRRLGYAPLGGGTDGASPASANPFPFMDLIGMPGRSNFFEERVSLYQRADVLSDDATSGAAGGAMFDSDF